MSLSCRTCSCWVCRFRVQVGGTLSDQGGAAELRAAASPRKAALDKGADSARPITIQAKGNAARAHRGSWAMGSRLPRTASSGTRPEVWAPNPHLPWTKDLLHLLANVDPILAKVKPHGSGQSRPGTREASWTFGIRIVSGRFNGPGVDRGRDFRYTEDGNIKHSGGVLTRLARFRTQQSGEVQGRNAPLSFVVET
jgi:hypothetical protein